VAHLGDDLTDLPVLERAGLAAAVANAVPEVLASSTWHGTVPGGRGAVREFARAILTARGVWNETVDGYLATGRAEGAPGGPRD
jgi:3-deoxy-D-manno-octulosonate 8-phosphate phosphatase (KDO 8-P phosphatase)